MSNEVSVITRISNGMSKNSAVILAGVAITGVITTAIFASKAGIVAKEILEREEKLSAEPADFFLSIKLTWTAYIPTVLMCSATVACIIGSSRIYRRRNAALAGAYMLAENAIQKYQDKVIATIGKKKEQTVRDDIVQDELDKHPPVEGDVIITGKGDHLCFDVLSGRYFRSDIESIRQAVNELNHNLLTDMWLPLNDLYYELSLESIELGTALGWTSDRLLEIQYTTKLTDAGEPCIVLNYNAKPDVIENCPQCY